MLTFSDKIIAKKDIDLFWEIRDLIGSINCFETPGFDEITCHILAEAVSRVFGLRHVIGCWRLGYEHSWCVTEDRNIIDVYPVGVIGGPILIARQVCGNGLYVEKELLWGDILSEKFNLCVERVVEQLKLRLEEKIKYSLSFK